MSYSKTLEGLAKRNVETTEQLEQAAVEETPIDRIAEHVTAFSGSTKFLVINLAVFGLWIAANFLMTKPFDPFPFSLLTLFLSIEAILLSIFILMSERRQAQMDQRRAKLDLQVNLLAEQENTKMLQLLVAIARKLDISTDDAELQALAADIAPEKLAKELERRKK